jgi:hypothetical protein
LKQMYKNDKDFDELWENVTNFMGSWWQLISLTFLVLHCEIRWFEICMEEAWIIIYGKKKVIYGKKKRLLMLSFKGIICLTWNAILISLCKMLYLSNNQMTNIK